MKGDICVMEIVEVNMENKKHRGRPINHKKVRVIETGNIYKSYADAAKAIQGHKGDILLCLRGHRKRHKGYSFEYVPDEDE